MRHLLRATRAVLRSDSIPRPLRALAAFGLLPIPGPLDEVALVLAAILLLLFYRSHMWAAWSDTRTIPPSRVAGLGRVSANVSLVLILLTVAGLGALTLGAFAAPIANPAAHGRCFPAQSWADGTVPDRYRPCIQVVRVEEDGSFKYRALDHGGTVRYSAGVGALDR